MDISGELRVRMAMQRRALAYHLASVCPFPKLDAIVQRMFSPLTKQPAKSQGIPRRVSAAAHHGRPGNVADSRSAIAWQAAN